VIIERILVTTDFSAAGDRAVRTAAEWARREKAALRILHVAPTRSQLAGLWSTSTSAVHTVHRQAAAALGRVAESVDPTRQLELSTGVVTGTAARKIVTAATDYRADLLVIGAYGENERATGQPGLGGTATKLTGTAPCALLLVRHPPETRPASVLAAIDLSRDSFDILTWASRCATGGDLHVLNAYEVPFASRLEAYGIAEGALNVYTDDEQRNRDREMASLIAEAGCSGSVHRLVERGDAATRLFAQIRKLNPTVIVLGTHTGRKGRPVNTRYGSVCRYTAFFAPTNVLIVPRAADSRPH